MVHLSVGMLAVLLFAHNEVGEDGRWMGEWEGLLVGVLVGGVDLD